MFKFGLLVTLFCLAIFVEEAHSCFGSFFGGGEPIYGTGKKKRDVEAVVEEHAIDMMSVDQVEDVQELEDAIASANKFTGRNVHAKKEYGNVQKWFG